MSGSELDQESLRLLVTDTVFLPQFRKATFGGAIRRKEGIPSVRVAIRPVELRGERFLQFSYFDAKKHITKNYSGQEVGPKLEEVLDAGFARIHLSTGLEEVDIRTTRKGKIFLGRRKAEPAEREISLAHNRIKDVPLPEGKADRFLEALGISTRDGHVRPARRAKFTQINEFLKHLAVAREEAGLGGLGRELVILDCGCGSSYLTLAVHHYLNDVVGTPAQILGVDVNEEVIRKSIDRSERLGAEHVAFSCGRIGQVDANPDIVLALHACDTATDDAIAQAIHCEAAVLLSVPCCHHDLNGMVRPAGPAEVLRPILRHGILHQRTADLVTDAFRALVLRIMGYRTDVVEFISPEHTARNVMIRAIRGPAVGETAFLREYREMRQFWGVTPYIEKAVGEPFQRLLSVEG